MPTERVGRRCGTFATLSAGVFAGVVLGGCSSAPDSAQHAPEGLSPGLVQSGSGVLALPGAAEPEVFRGPSDDVASDVEVARAVARANAVRTVEAGPPPAELGSVLGGDGLVRGSDGATVRREPAPASLPRRDRIRRHVAELADMLRAEADDAPAPAAVLAQLAALELIEPGIFHSRGSDLEGASALLSEQEIAVLGPWRDFFASARDRLDSTGSVFELAGEADSLARSLGRFEPLMVPRAVLATRVSGYGSFDALRRHDDRYKLLAGRPHVVIVYAEVERFLSRATRSDGADGHEVNLDVQLRLYHYSEDRDLLVWRTEPQSLRDFSMNRRDDFYLTQKVTLPRTLTVGSYSLKVSVTDRNADGVVAESVIPIDIIADRSALSSAE
ncbi:MAG: hypothetical protein AAGI30_04005 [Planctomycetota bacterium]